MIPLLSSRGSTKYPPEAGKWYPFPILVSRVPHVKQSEKVVIRYHGATKTSLWYRFP